MNATTNNGTTTTTRDIPAEFASMAEAMDAFKGVKAIMNRNGFSRVVRVYRDPFSKDLFAVGVNGRTEWFVGCHCNTIKVTAGGMCTLAWAWGHYYRDASHVVDEVDGMQCVWDMAIDGGF